MNEGATFEMAATSCHFLPATTINIHCGGSTVYQQRSAGLSSTSSLLLSRYSICSSHASDSNEDESTSSATPRTRSFQSSTLGRANNSNQSPPISLNSLLMKSLTNLTLKVHSPLPITIITLLILAASGIELLLS